VTFIRDEDMPEIIRGQRCLLRQIEIDAERNVGTSSHRTFLECAQQKREFIANLEEALRLARS
jgi:ribosomal protein S1